MKFLCDHMLGSLGKWLRIAGYDTQIASPSAADQALFDQARNEKRILLTRDKHFKEMNDPDRVVLFLKGNSLEEWVEELNSSLKLNWFYRPFSRCVVCNSLLEKPNETDILAQVPPDVRIESQDCWYCGECKKVYWEGGHTKRMLQQLETWQKNASA